MTPQELRYRMRREGLATGQTHFGTAIFHTVSQRIEREFDPHQFRMREIEKVITSRHGVIVPDPCGTDDFDTCLDYARAVAGALSGQNLQAWARRWMPWADRAELDRIAASVGWRKHMLGADQCARLLGVTMEERTRLELRTIGACDLTRDERKEATTAKRRERDRDRKAEARRADGRLDRDAYIASSTTAAKPWDAEGVSRATWYRRKRETGVSSLVDNTSAVEQPVSGGLGGGASRAPVRHGAAKSPITTAKRSHGEHDGEVLDQASAPASVPLAALRVVARTAGQAPHRNGDLKAEDAA